MRTVMILVGGLGLVGLCIAATRWFAGVDADGLGLALKIFAPIWLVVAAANMWMGVAQAGYSIAEETPIFLAIFAVPTAVAAAIWWKFS